MAGWRADGLILGGGRAAAATGTSRRPERSPKRENPGTDIIVTRVKSSHFLRLRMSHQKCGWMPLPWVTLVTGSTGGLGPVR